VRKNDGVRFELTREFVQYTFTGPLKDPANAFRTHSFLTTDGLSAKTQIRQMFSAIPWQPSNQNLFWPDRECGEETNLVGLGLDPAQWPY
jgi:hypothetical protein